MKGVGKQVAPRIQIDTACFFYIYILQLPLTNIYIYINIYVYIIIFLTFLLSLKVSLKWDRTRPTQHNSLFFILFILYP